MSNDLITPENLSNELLHSIFDAAFMETSWDSEGGLRVTDNISCFVFPSKDGDRITLISMFRFKEDATQSERLICVNNINKQYAMIRATSSENDNLHIVYDIWVKGGITKKAVVLATKFFLSIPIDAITSHGKDLVT